MAQAANPSSSPSDAVCLDLGVVTALRELGGEDDPELFHDLVETFALDTPPRVDAIEDAVRCEDAEGLFRAAHGLKSSAANMGACHLAETCRLLEARGKEGRLEGTVELVSAARRQFEAALAALEQQRGRS